MKPKNHTALLSCPFCGGRGSPFLGDGGSEWIRCSQCAATSQKAWLRETYDRAEWTEVIAERRKQACAFWNRRLVPATMSFSCSARHGERVAWHLLKSCGILIGYVEWSFDAAEGWSARTISWQARPKTAIQPTQQELRRVEKLLVKNRNRGGVFERETSWPKQD
jgi:sarcosine oxidase delta subunit